MAKTIFESITDLRYVADEAQVEALASIVANGGYAKSTYLKVLLAHTVNDLGNTRKPTKAATLAILDSVHDRLYLSVLKGVGDVDVILAERQRRAVFARTAASTLRKFITRGGDVRKLDVNTVTKNALRDFGKRVPTGTRVQRALQRSAAAVIRAALRLARKDPDDARERLEAIRDEIEEALDNIGEPKTRAPAKRVAVVTRPPRSTVRPAAPPVH